MAEEVLGVITRATQKGFLFPKDVVLVFTNKRVFILQGSVVKGLMASAIPILGGLWGLKKLREEDKMVNLPIEELKEKAEKIIPFSDIENIEVKGGFWRMGATDIEIETDEEKLVFRTLEGEDRVTALINKLPIRTH